MSGPRTGVVKGEVVVCENDHVVALVADDMPRGSIVRAACLDFDPTQPRYKPYDALGPCAVCGAAWFRWRGGRGFALLVRGRGWTS